jgi:hypothetical protein
MTLPGSDLSSSKPPMAVMPLMAFVTRGKWKMMIIHWNETIIFSDDHSTISSAYCVG